MSAAKQYLIAGLCKYAVLIVVPLTIAFIYFKVYTVAETISYTLIALMLGALIVLIKFGKRTLDREFPDRFRWIGKLIGQVILTCVIIGLLAAIKSYIDTVIYMAIFVAIGEVCAIPFTIWQNIAKLKDYENNFGTQTIAQAIKTLKGGGGNE